MWSQSAAAVAYPAMQQAAPGHLPGADDEADLRDAHRRWRANVLAARELRETPAAGHGRDALHVLELSDPGDLFDDNAADWFADHDEPLLRHRGASKLARASRKYLNVGKDGVPLGNAPHPEDFEVMHGSSLLQLRARVWVALNEPDSSRWSYRLSMLMLTAIVLSTVVLCVGTAPSLRDDADTHAVMASVETCCIMVFTVEFVAKALCAPSQREFLTDPMNGIDLASFLPWYLDLIVCADSTCRGGSSTLKITQVLRVLRLVRIFRVLKFGHHFQKLQVLGTALRESSDVMLMLVFILGIIITLFSALVYQAERNRVYVVNPDTGQRVFFNIGDNLYQVTGLADVHSVPLESLIQRHQFSSIPATFWFMIVTLMTVGYGDMYPTTVFGQLVTALAMILSAMVLALPISVIGTNFTQAWMDQKERKRHGKAGDRATPAAIPLLVQMMLSHMSNVHELVQQLRGTCTNLGAEFAKLGFKMRRTRYDCLTMMQQVQQGHSGSVKEALETTKKMELDLLETMEEHELKISSHSDRLVDLLRVADILQNFRDDAAASRRGRAFTSFGQLLGELQDRIGRLADSAEKSFMIRAKVSDLELAAHEAMVMMCEVESVAASAFRGAEGDLITTQVDYGARADNDGQTSPKGT